MSRRSPHASWNDPAPLSAAQLAALAQVAARELLWALPSGAAEVRGLLARARAIPDPRLREDAIDSLTRKRPHLDGAGIFASLPARRNRALLCALVSFEAILEYLDNAHERASDAGISNGRRLHAALVDAVAPRRPERPDYYRDHPWHADGGYLSALVDRCRRAVNSLPSYPAVHEQLVEQARLLAQVLPLNHDADPALRETRLRQWAAQHPADDEWFERSASATGSLAVHGLLALAAEPALGAQQITQALAVHRRSSLLATMLDSYADQTEDAIAERHSYVAYYDDPDAINERLKGLIGECLSVAGALPNARQMLVIIASMIALYLTSDSSRAPALQDSTRTLLRSGGSLTMLLAPVLRAWRIAYRLTGA